MSTNFPTSLDSFTNPTGTDLMENASAALDHDAQHSNENDAIEALQAKVGIDSSAVTTSHDYKLSGVTGSDKAVSKTGTETLTNKTLTSPTINVTSDATGDIYYRSSGGAFTRLAIGSNTNILAVSASGIPEWITNPDTADASTTVKGVSELATSTEINNGTATGGTGAALVVTPDALAASNYVTTTVTNAILTDVQEFTSSGTWTKPSGALKVLVQAWGGGGAGGGKDANNGSAGGGGGGGGYVEGWFDPADLGATETVTVGAGGTGVSAADGNTGSNTTFGSLLTAYGGGGGGYGSAGGEGSGGGGGGTVTIGNDAVGPVAGGGGRPDAGAAGSSSEGGGSGFGGGGGGDGTNQDGGASAHGGGGGGANQGDGGKASHGGGGGGGGGDNGNAAGAAGTSVLGGDGGAGSNSGNGNAGSQPGGGGGGAGSNDTNTRTGGDGGDGQVIVTTFR